jgi:Holliday junction resolvase
MTHGRTDENQGEIIKALRKAGYTVEVTSNVGNGFPDLVTCVSGAFVLLECKMPQKKLTAKEMKFHKKFLGCPVFVVYSAEDALLMLERLKGFRTSR